MFREEDVSFPAEGGIKLSAWLFVPDADGPLPAITMAHGYAGTKYHVVEPFADDFARAGFADLLHDHRGGQGRIRRCPGPGCHGRDAPTPSATLRP